MKNVGLCITEKSAKLRTLELVAIVNYPVIKAIQDDEDMDEVIIAFSLFVIYLSSTLLILNLYKEFPTKGRRSTKRKALNTGFNPSTSVDGRSKRLCFLPIPCI